MEVGHPGLRRDTVDLRPLTFGENPDIQVQVMIRKLAAELASCDRKAHRGSVCLDKLSELMKTSSIRADLSNLSLSLTRAQLAAAMLRSKHFEAVDRRGKLYQPVSFA